jgi:aspartyl-tRNA(Asn)/glutamyl-tRNA(Gln) amidotransferase subunit A
LSDDLTYASIAQLGVRLRQKKTSAEEIVRAAIQRTQALDPTLNSYITFLPEAALEQARRADRQIRGGTDLGPLHGIPCSIKDHIDTSGIPTTAGARFRLSNVPTRDAPIVRRLKEAGAIVMGKANMNKWAGGESGDNPDFGKIRTPWNVKFSAGGSSGGSGAMVAAGMVTFSVGTDNGGSIRIPAALCGIVGLKPTYGRVSTDGIFPRAYSFDHAGPLARSVEDCASVLQAIAGHGAGDATTSRKPVPDYVKALAEPLRSVRIGVDRRFAGFGEAVVLDRWETALTALTRLGASIHDVVLPPPDEFVAVVYQLSAEFSACMRDLWRQHPTEFSAEDRSWQLACELVPAVDYIRAGQQRRLLQVAYARATQAVDVLACPSYPFARRPFEGFPTIEGRPATFDDAVRYTSPFDILGLPAISVPCGFSDDGSPIGLQLVGRAFDEPTVLRVAHAFEQGTEWHTRRPAI